MAAALFFVVRAYNRFRRRAEPTTKPCPLCATDVPVAARRCPHCTSELQPA